MKRSVLILIAVLAVGTAPVASAASAKSAPHAASKKKKKPKRGPRGKTGPKGDTGPAGLRGDKGDKGDKGEQGQRGPSAAFSFVQPADIPNTGAVYDSPSNTTTFAPLVYATTGKVPAGAQAVTARFFLTTSGSTKMALCELAGADKAPITVVPGSTEVTLSGSMTTTADAVEVIVCTFPTAVVGDHHAEQVIISATHITAIQVGAETHGS